MNLPSSLALPQSKLLRSRVGILILAAAALLIGGVAYFVVGGPATAPAAQVLPRSIAPAPVTAPVVYGPPAPAWVKRDLSVVPQTPVASAPVVGAPSTVKTVGANPTATASAPVPASSAVPNSSVPPAAATAAAAASKVASTAVGTAMTVPGAATVVPGAGASVLADETPKVLDANTLFQREQYVYQAAGRRDPFQSLIDGKYESQSGDGSLVDVGDIHLVGIMWGSSDKFALVEDSRGRGFVLRVGDPVVNGYIAGISKTELQVVQNSFGDSQTVTIQLKSKEEGEPNATRN